jgi:hypothetical protein
MAVVMFYPDEFTIRYPEFSGVDFVILSAYFSEATLYLDNSDSSRVQDVGQRSMLLNMLVAHIALLYSGANGAQSSPLVGRVNAASEGSVSVSAAMDGVPGTAAWFMQTKYGASYWQATARFRTMRYVPGSSSPGPFPCGPFGFPSLP